MCTGGMSEMYVGVGRDYEARGGFPKPPFLLISTWGTWA
jgi:hypothetical protein